MTSNNQALSALRRVLIDMQRQLAELEDVAGILEANGVREQRAGHYPDAQRERIVWSAREFLSSSLRSNIQILLEQVQSLERDAPPSTNIAASSGIQTQCISEDDMVEESQIQ